MICARLTDVRSEQEGDATRGESDPVRCSGCGGWITLHRLDTQGCTTCRILAATQ